ncbi:hypothetical protein CPB86DRAFT_594586 [Serendipita vermifera]|nr:hypothetical protein CPB86DRAFT_594586 [Serendipita vermifera]
MRSAHAFIFVFDMTNPRSFDGLARWLKKAKDAQTNSARGAPRILIGNKIDLTDDVAVDISTVKEFAQEHGMKFIQASAKASINIEEPIIRVIGQLIEEYVPFL